MRTMIIVVLAVAALYIGVTTLHNFMAGEDGKVFEATEEVEHPRITCKKACAEEMDECERLCIEEISQKEDIREDRKEAEILWCTQACRNEYTECLGRCNIANPVRP